MKITIKKISFATFGIFATTFCLVYIVFLNYQNKLSRPESQRLKDISMFRHKLDILRYKLNILERNNVNMKHIISNANLGKAAAGMTSVESVRAENFRLDFSSGFHQALSSAVPSDTYERTRRAMERDIKELWYTTNARSGNIGAKYMDQIRDLCRTLRSHLVKLRVEDGFEAFRKKETDELGNLVQNRLRALQNPKNCENAKKLVCDLSIACGFGCQSHHLSYCLIVAYATGRTLILESRGWKYNNNGWETIFLPISDTCTTIGSKKCENWIDGNKDSSVLKLPMLAHLYSIKQAPQYLPFAIPADIADRLKKVHGEPHIWWVGQFVKYLLRLQPHLQVMINETVSNLGIASPTVGIHVRRTDKIGTEASFHNLTEYMVHAEDYFAILEKVQGKIKRRVFIASDEPDVISEAINSYSQPKWEIMADRTVAQSASVNHRYTESGLQGILKDIFMLAECDFVVCTFSSQICRLVYELFQAKHVDASDRFVSLDDIYYFAGGRNLIQIVEVHHIPGSNEEIEINVGDKISVAGNHKNGMSKGMNLRTKKTGLYPSYKVRNIIPRVNFPEVKWWLGMSLAEE